MRRALLTCVFVLACGEHRYTRASTPLADALMAVAHEWSENAADDAWARAELDRIAAAVGSAARRQPEVPRSAVLNQTVFGSFGFVREVSDESLRFVFLPAVLRSRRGTCVGLGSLYLALAERLGWQLSGVMVPGHFFVRIAEAGTHHNLELLHRGELMPDDWYRVRFPIAGGAAPEYARSLTASEVIGVVEYNVGNQRKRQEQWLEARRAYTRARTHFSDFAEAHASLGATAQLLGLLDEARASYVAALRANPNLPGVDKNLALLDSEPLP